jgi:type III secretory pathway component EscS
MLVLQGAALVLAGILTSAGYMLAPSFSKGLLFFLDGKENAYVWSGAAGVAFGMGLARLASYLKSLPRPKGSNYTVAIAIGSFIASLIAATQYPLATLEFFILLFYILPCSMLSYGIATGRLWAVVTGIFLDMLIALGSPSGAGRDPVELALFASLFLATLELAYSSATYKGVLDRELAEAAAEPVRRHITRTVKETVGCYYTRLAAGMLASSLAVAAALIIFSAPGLFGESYGASIEAQKITALLLPGLLVLGTMSAGLLIPRDLPKRAQGAAVRARRLFTSFAAPSRLLSSRQASRTPSRR